MRPLPINPFIVSGLFLVGFSAGAYASSRFVELIAFSLIMYAAVPFISRVEQRWYVKHSRPGMTYPEMLLINVSEVAATMYGLLLGYVILGL